MFTARKRSLGQGNIFTPVCHSVHRGACVVAPVGGVRGCSRGGHAWLLPGGHAWLLWRGLCGCSWGACVVALGGCVLLLGGHAWLLPGGHAWDMTRYGDTINERVVRILLECILVLSVSFKITLALLHSAQVIHLSSKHYPLPLTR